MWYRLIRFAEWFGDMRDRFKLIRAWNAAAKQAFIQGYAPTLLEARITWGNSSYKHAFSKFMGGGFRIKALSGAAMSRAELIEIGQIIIANQELVRQLVALGWDTFEVHDNHGALGCQWALKDHTGLGGLLGS